MVGLQKRTFRTIFLLTTIALLVLPAVTTFNELLTGIVMQVRLYRYIQEFIVPFQARMIAVVLQLFGITASATATGIALGDAKAIGNIVTISWNCSLRATKSGSFHEYKPSPSASWALSL